MALTKKQQSAFASLQSAIAAAAAGFIYAQKSDVDVFVSAGLVEVNETMTDEHGAVAVRLVQSTETATPAEAVAAPVVAAPKFAIASGIEIPKVVRQHGSGAGRQAMYPFESMELNQSFFVAATAEKPNPAKSLASTVTSANSRFAVEIEGTRINRKGRTVPNTKQEREFTIRAIADGAPWGFPGVKGAAVWRIL